MQNIEIIIRGVQARMSLRPQRRTKNNKVLRYARMDDIHRAHRPAGVVEDPFARVGVERDELVVVVLGGGDVGCLGVFGCEVLDDVVDYAREVLSVCLDCVVRDGVDEGRVEDVELVLWCEQEKAS